MLKRTRRMTWTNAETPELVASQSTNFGYYHPKCKACRRPLVWHIAGELCVSCYAKERHA